MTIIDKLKDKRCRGCKYYNIYYCACMYRANTKYGIGRYKNPKLICFDKKEVENG